MELSKEVSSPRSGAVEELARREESKQSRSPSRVFKSSVSFSGAGENDKPSGYSSSLTKKMSVMSLGESAAGSGDFSSFGTSDFLKKSATTTMFGVPPGFFESRGSIRIWGVDELADPMVQPYDKTDPNLPRPFHVSLPGYEPRLCKYALAKTEKAPRDPLLGPEISLFPPTWIPYWKPDPNFKPQNYNFNWEDNGTFQMERLPYVNAIFEPADGSAHNMYNQAYPYTAYPYGVPRV
ncbi:inner membrane complex protein 22 [Cystoisospora suis]|uniref:Inner membrane complex protein 22 n=1 Tax=Cystoisospora suis TaxID=483139 RepID=A0A2C6L0V5_9APIC|nr:inner membrane complex protein 22 [Cystoisospora suis]